MLTILRAALIGAIALTMAILTVWCAGALWFRLPAGDLARGAAAGLAGLAGLVCTLALFTRRRTAALGVFALLFAGIAAWWSTIEPVAHADWSPDVARQTHGTIDGDTLTLHDIRAFDWRTREDFTEGWVSDSYDLGTLQGVDMFMSYWGDPLMAHMILSFGFADGRQLAWSVEVRRKKNSGFSPIADFFKEHTLSILAAQERDVVGVRSNVRGEDVQLFRLRAAPQVARKLLEEYVRDANALARQPAFYNSIFTNCTTTVIRMMAAVGDRLPFDWRLVVNGYLPDYAHDQGALAKGYTVEELRELGRIVERAQAHGLKPGFAQAVRVGVPAP